MRLGLLPVLLIVGCAGISYANPADGQEVLERKISLSADQVEIKAILNEISKKADVKFVYSAQKIPARQIASCIADDEQLGVILNKLLLPFNVMYEVKGNKIVLTKIRGNQSSQDPSQVAEISEKEDAVVAPKPITGKVVDEKGDPLTGVSIKVKGSSAGTSTNVRGEFSIDVPDNAILIISYVGYDTKEVAVQKSETLSIKLSPSASTKLSDVIVVGYQEQKRRKLTSSIVTISGKEIQDLPSPSFEQLLQGRVPGLNVQNLSGQPGVKNSFVVRGNTVISRNLLDDAQATSNPLFVIDGVPMNLDDLSNYDFTNTNSLAGLNPNDIESMDILKDAAAVSIYGSRGANGVILIRTKKGNSGKPRISLNFYTGLTDKPQLKETVIGAEERRMKINWLNYWANNTPGKSPYTLMRSLPMVLTDSLNPAFNNATDWQGIFFKSGIIRNADFSVSGGNDLSNYRLSLNYYDEDGIIIGTGYKRYSVASAYNVKVGSKVDISTLIKLQRGDRAVGRGANRNDQLPIGSDGYNFPSSAFAPSEDQMNNYSGVFKGVRDVNINDNIVGSFILNYKFIPKFNFNSQLNVTLADNSRDRFIPAVLDAQGISYASSSKGKSEYYTMTNTVSYVNSFKEKHNLNLVAGQSFEFTKFTSNHINGTHGANDQIGTVSGIDQRYLNGASDYGSYGILSYFSQLTYDFNDKYIANFNIRTDGSSRFGANRKWGVFPSASVGWIVSNEKFMEKSNLIQFLKLRASYGSSGDQPQSIYAPYNRYQLNQGGFNGNGAASSYNGVLSVIPDFGTVTQKDLTWATTQEWNAGLDLRLFKNNRVDMSVDIYNRDKNNIIFAIDVPSTSGYESIQTNAVGVRNSGIELNVNTRNIIRKSFEWKTNFNISYNQNKVIELPNGGKDLVLNDGNTILTVGRPLYEYFLVKSNGVFPTNKEVPLNPYTGNPMSHWYEGNYVYGGYFNWADLNGDYIVWDHKDKRRVGNPNPRYYGGFSNEFFYKNFMLGIYCNFTLGREIFNSYSSTQLDNLVQLGNLYTSQIPDLWKTDTWKKPGDNAHYANINPYGPYYYQFYAFSSAFMENGSYLRVKTVRLGYSFPEKITRRLKLQRLRLYSVMDNVWLFKKSDVPDPENVDAYGRYGGNVYPTPHKYTFGIDISF